jgi:hypothetical protein
LAFFADLAVENISFKAVTFNRRLRPYKQTTKKEFIMRKSTLFLSAVLTTFVMAMLAGVASAYQGIVSSKQLGVLQPLTQTQDESQTKSVADAIPAEVQTVNLTPEEAAGLAAQVLGRDDLFSVEVTDLNGETVFMVTFTSGDLVYVSLDGQIRSIGQVQVETVVVSSGGGGGGGGGNNTPNNTSQSNEDHDDDDHDDEDHEEREEHEDDDDD